MLKFQKIALFIIPLFERIHVASVFFFELDYSVEILLKFSGLGIIQSILKITTE